MNGPFNKSSRAISFQIFLSRVVQKYSYMTECIFNIICDIVMNIVKYGFHVFKIDVKIDVMSISDTYLR